MKAVWYRFRAELRMRWRAWIAVGVFIGIGAGCVGAALAGARRTDSSYDRLLRDAHAFDVIAIGGFCDEPRECPVGAVTQLPQVVDSARVAVHSGRLRTEDGVSVQPGGDPEFTGPGEVSLISAPDGRFGTDINRYRVVEGRLPDPRAAREVAISKALADRLDLHPGDSLRAELARSEPDQAAECSPTTGCETTTDGDRQPSTQSARLEIVGIEVAPFEIPPPSGEYHALVHATPAFHERSVAQGLEVSDGLALRLHDGAAGAKDLEAELFERRDLGIALVFHQADQAKSVRRSITPHAVALGVLGAAAALVVLVLFGSVLVRQVFFDSIDNPLLGSLGLRRRELWQLSMARAGVVAVVAAIVSIGVSFALSPLTPIGIARDAEPHPGVRFDAPVLLGAACVTAFAVLLLAGLAAWRAARVARTGSTPRPSRPSAAAERAARAGAAPTVVVGLRMATDAGRGRSAVPVRVGFVGVTAGIIALAAALGFSGGLAHLLETPRLSGWGWDAAVYVGSDGSTDATALARDLARTDGVETASTGTYFFSEPFPDHQLLVGKQRLELQLLAFEPGSIGPSVIDGRAPATADEILVGPETLDQLGLHIGDTVLAIGQVGESNRPDSLADTRARMRIVGTGVIPPVAGGGARLGRGATVTIDGLRVLNPVATADVVYLRFDASASHRQVVADLRRALGSADDSLFVGSQLPTELLNVRQIDDFPTFFALLVGVVAAGVLIHVLVTSTRARRRDLAVLRTLGFTRRQLSHAVQWEATTVVLVALVIGLPLGWFLGTLAWRAYASELGVVPEPSAPWWWLALATVVALAVANAVALLPARAAARTHPETVLRSE